MQMKDILVLGIGNLVLRDEGVGIHAVDYLQKQNLPANIDLLDGGTGGIALIGILQEYRRVILIDATLDNNPPGTIRHLRPQYSQDYPPLLSAHEIGLKEMIVGPVGLIRRKRRQQGLERNGSQSESRVELRHHEKRKSLLPPQSLYRLHARERGQKHRCFLGRTVEYDDQQMAICLGVDQSRL